MRPTALLLLILFPLLLRAQEPDTVINREVPPAYDSLTTLYPFLRTDSNHFSGNTASLLPLFRKLDRIRNGSNEQAVIVHLGDSHVQAGAFTAPLRDSLQARYGNAGRGMIFPYRLAKSNGPGGYISRCDTPWVYGRNATVKKPLPTGLAGFTLRSVKSSASFTVEFTLPPQVPGDSLLVTIYHAPRDTCYTFILLNNTTDSAYPVIDTSQSDRTAFLVNNQSGSLRVRATKMNENQRSATFYGMTLTGFHPGVIVHTIGVNGARYDSYLESEHFAEQFRTLKPDLLIVSLGTNEAYESRNFSAAELTGQIDSLMIALGAKGGNLPVILTTPPGIYKGYRHRRRTTYKPNPAAAEAAAVIRTYAADNGMVCWDWYTIMGGKEAMAKWKAKKMTDKKMVHFSGKGYAIQGYLLYRALEGQHKLSER